MLKGLMAGLGLARDLAWFDRRVVLEDQEIDPVPEGTGLKVSEQHYTVAAPLQAVFDAYLHAQPDEAWPAEWIRFHFALLPGSRERLDADNYPGALPVGSRVFVELKCRPLQRWLCLMVGVEVTRIDPGREIRYEYLEGSVTMGHNSMFFEAAEDEDGQPCTRIHHYSEYRGTSLLLRTVMPLFQPTMHVGFVDALHRGMKERIEAGAGSDEAKGPSR